MGPLSSTRTTGLSGRPGHGRRSCRVEGADHRPLAGLPRHVDPQIAAAFGRGAGKVGMPDALLADPLDRIVAYLNEPLP